MRVTIVSVLASWAVIYWFQSHDQARRSLTYSPQSESAPASTADVQQSSSRPVVATVDVDSARVAEYSAARAAPAHRSDELTIIYAANEVGGDQEFKGRVLKVEGVFERVGIDLIGNPYLIVTTPNSDGGRLQCFFPKNKAAPLGFLFPKSKVTVVGRVKGKMMNVLMEDCELVD